MLLGLLTVRRAGAAVSAPATPNPMQGLNVTAAAGGRTTALAGSVDPFGFAPLLVSFFLN